MSEPHEKAVDRPCYDPRQHRVVGHGSRGPVSYTHLVADVLGNSLKKLNQPNLVTIFVGIALGVLLGSIPLRNVPQPVKLGLAGGPLIVAIPVSYTHLSRTPSSRRSRGRWRSSGSCAMPNAPQKPR